LFKSLKTNVLGKSAIAIATTMFVSAPAMAADYQINVQKCPAVKGSLKIDTSNAAVWSQVKSKDQSSLVKSMVENTNCFTMASGDSYAQYTMRFGALTADEYNAGASRFAGRSVLDPVPVQAGGIPQSGGIPQGGGGIPQGESGSGGGLSLGSIDSALGTAQRVEYGAKGAEYYAKRGVNVGKVDSIRDVRGGLRNVGNLSSSIGSVGNMFGSSGPKVGYAYVEIVNSAGQTVARGFGRNDNAKLSFDGFQGAGAISKSKKSKRQAGALYTALTDAQSKIMAPGFGSPIQ